MAGNMTDYLEDALLKTIMGEAQMTMPSGLYLALFTDDPTETGILTSEVADANGYARYDLANATMSNVSGGYTSNQLDIIFLTATGAWGTVTHLGLMDSATHGAGNMLFHSVLAYGIPIVLDDTFEIKATKYSITLD